MVTVLTGRSWRPYAGPVAFLLAATIAIGLVRGHLGSQAASAPRAKELRPHVAHVAAKPAGPRLYVVRAGDTIEAIASGTGTTTAAIMRLNPTVTPTALFIGEKLKLR
ncbi:MAG TPA: LysM domain-containing protein [Gaiellaceae bacterium]|nr:LysM domain-containing protein [Gaiellaceae bacterium]